MLIKSVHSHQVFLLEAESSSKWIFLLTERLQDFLFVTSFLLFLYINNKYQLEVWSYLPRWTELVLSEEITCTISPSITGSRRDTRPYQCTTHQPSLDSEKVILSPLDSADPSPRLWDSMFWELRPRELRETSRNSSFYSERCQPTHSLDDKSTEGLILKIINKYILSLYILY